MLKVEHISAGYGKKQVLFDVSLEVFRGEIVLLAGSNGSGKSTLLKAIYGLLPLMGMGNILFNGKCLTRTAPYRRIREGLVYVPQRNNCFHHLTVKENLEVSALHFRNRSLLKGRVEGALDILPQLGALQSRKPFDLSGGERQQLSLGMALVQRPGLIMLDEPGAGLAPYIWQQNLSIIKNLNRSGIAFLIVEHKLKESYAIADKIITLRLGKIFSSTEVDDNFHIDALQTAFI